MTGVIGDAILRRGSSGGKHGVEMEGYAMKHVRRISLLTVRPAQDLTIGQILSVVAQLMTVVATALLAKDAA